jgi:hypothetical protein
MGIWLVMIVERATHSISLLDADHLFYGNLSHGGARFHESADKHTERH